MAMTVHLLPPFELQIQSTNSDVRAALSSLRDALGPLHLAAEEQGTVELVLAEILNNIVEHAYANTNAEAGAIVIHCLHNPDGLHLKVTDHGKPLPNGALPSGCRVRTDVELEDLPEGGFGWFLIKKIGKDLKYQRFDGKNQLELRLAVGVTQ